MTTKKDKGNFKANFYFTVNETNFLEIWDKLTYIGLTPSGWIRGKSKYEALNDMVDSNELNRAIEVRIDTSTKTSWFMVWCGGFTPYIDKVDVDDVMVEITTVKKNAYRGNK